MDRLVACILAFASGWTCVEPAAASEVQSATDQDCFDAIVRAEIVRQTPTLIPECDDCIIMSWPWVLELDVERVSKGQVALGPLTVLTVQHTYYRTDLGARRWLLRRNSLGTFNVLRIGKKTEVRRCASNLPPAKPYIRPSQGRTLSDLVEEGEKYYGKGP
jgi:hypothetical protein